MIFINSKVRFKNTSIIRGTILLLWIVLVVITLSACKDKVKSSEVELKRQAISGLQIKEIEPSKVEEVHETTGTVRSKNSSIVSSKVMGVVTNIYVKEGDFVKKGDLLLTIDDSDSKQRLISAQMALESARENKKLAQTTYDRYKRLYDEKALSGQELDQIETQRKVAELEYERLQALYNEAKIYHSYTILKSPQDGIVSAKKIDIGTMAIMGNPLMVIDGSGSYQVEASLDESMLQRIKQAMDVTIQIDSISKETKGKITEIVPTVDPMTRTFIIKISLTDTAIKSGQFVKVKIPIGSKEAIVIPQDVVVKKGQLTGVYAVDKDGVITYRLIKLGKRHGSSYEVLSGLQPKDRIVVEGLEKVVDGGKMVEEKAK